MSFAEDLLSTLGKDTSSIEVSRLLTAYGLLDVFDEPPFRRYVGNSDKGIDLLVENDKVLDIQFYAQRSMTHMPFQGDLPFGVMVGMTDKDVHALLGNPEARDAVGSKYSVLDGVARLTVVYDKSNVISYLSVRRV